MHVAPLEVQTRSYYIFLYKVLFLFLFFKKKKNRGSPYSWSHLQNNHIYRWTIAPQVEKCQKLVLEELIYAMFGSFEREGSRGKESSGEESR